MEDFIGRKVLFMAHLYSTSWVVIHWLVNERRAAGDEYVLRILGGHRHDIKSDYEPCPQSIRGQSVYFIITFSPFSLLYCSSDMPPFRCVVMDKVRILLNTVFLCPSAFSTPHKDKRIQLSPLPLLQSHPSDLDLTLEDACGPVLH